MKRFLFIIIIFLSKSYLLSQPEPTPSDLLDYLKQSNKKFFLSELNEYVEVPNFSERILYPFFYRDDSKYYPKICEYKLSDSVKYYDTLAENEYMFRKFKKARYYYLKAIYLNSGYFDAYRNIGETYFFEKNYNKAIYWFEKLLRFNYIDDRAHLYLANIYKEQGKLDNAINSAALALVLNRNNPVANSSLNQYLKQKNHDTTNWVFNPQFSVEEKQGDSIKVKGNRTWLFYGLATAATKYDHRMKTFSHISDSVEMTYESAYFCALVLANAVTNLETNWYREGAKGQNPAKADRSIEMLLKARKDGLLEEFVFFEIILPRYPAFIYNLPRDYINRIKNYVVNFRYAN